MTVMCLCSLYNGQMQLKRVITLQEEINGLKTKIEAYSNEYVTVSTFYKYKIEIKKYKASVNKELEAHKWQYEQYQSLDGVLDNMFGDGKR